MTDYKVAEVLAGNRENVLNNITVVLERDENNTPDEMTQETVLTGISACLALHYRNIADEVDAVLRHGIKRIIDRYGIGEAEAWKTAYKNLECDTCITSMTEALTGEATSEDYLYVISNKSKSQGAACVLNNKAIRSFAEAHGTHRIAVLPSSVHEMILVPHPENFGDVNTFSQMVAQINATEVEPSERLTDKAYEIEI